MIPFTPTTFDAQSEYKRILGIFESKLQMKHLLKGTSHLEMSYEELGEVFSSELQEFDNEMQKTESDFRKTKAIEEAVDVMISAMIIADKILRGI